MSYQKIFVIYNVKDIANGDEAFGALGPFNQGMTQWSSYAERMEEYLLANDVTEERKKVVILVSTIGSQTYDLLKDLYTHDKPNTKSFEEIVTKLVEH